MNPKKAQGKRSETSVNFPRRADEGEGTASEQRRISFEKLPQDAQNELVDKARAEGGSPCGAAFPNAQDPDIGPESVHTERREPSSNCTKAGNAIIQFP